MLEPVVEPMRGGISGMLDNRRRAVSGSRVRIAEVHAIVQGVGCQIRWISKRILHRRPWPVIDTGSLQRRKRGSGGLQVKLLITDAFAVTTVRKIARREVILEFQ